ncbi:MAG: purine-binding chemotaxis protein CheW [Candidatus Omnitrophica bacterium]|nr:purine-binding chemotaxis protein CheW [Candidatus Omnitrophota bacterium]
MNSSDQTKQQHPDKDKESKGAIDLRVEEWLNKEPLPEQTRQVVLFSLNEEWYGVDMQNVRIVVSKPPITPMPFVPDYIAGIINLRGTVLSVIDLRVLFEFDQTDAGANSYIIVIESGGIATGLLVDHLVVAVEIPLSKFRPVSASFEPGQCKWIESQVHWDEKMIAMIQAKRFIDETRRFEEQ